MIPCVHRRMPSDGGACRNFSTYKSGSLSEWLRRKIRNLLGFARAGSNPAAVAIFFFAVE